jgi:hypothetical protein
LSIHNRSTRRSGFIGFNRRRDPVPAAPKKLIYIFRRKANPQLAHCMWSLFKEFLRFARREKKWWLIPLVVALLLLGVILIFTSSSGLSWALYPSR